MSTQIVPSANIDNTAANALKPDFNVGKVSRFRRFIKAYGASPTKFKIGLGIIIFFVLVSIIGPFVRPYNPNANLNNPIPNAAPSSNHLLGTDYQGEDVLSELLVGTGPTILLGLIVGTISTLVSIIIGLLAGYYGGPADQLISLFTNIILIIPALPLLIVILGLLQGQGGILLMALVLSALSWAWGAKAIRAQTLSLRNQDFVSAARETGESNFRIMVVEILPRMVSLVASSFIFTVLYAITASVGLMYLGLGLGGAASTSLGGILFNANNNDATLGGEIWEYMPPALIVAVFGMGLVLMNYGLDEIGNPRLKDANRLGKIGKKAMRPSDPTPVLTLSATNGKRSFWSDIRSKDPLTLVKFPSDSKG